MLMWFRPSQNPPLEKRGRRPLPEGWQDAFRLLHRKGWMDKCLGKHFGRSGQWALQKRHEMGLSANGTGRVFGHERKK